MKPTYILFVLLLLGSLPTKAQYLELRSEKIHHATFFKGPDRLYAIGTEDSLDYRLYETTVGSDTFSMIGTVYGNKGAQHYVISKADGNGDWVGLVVEDSSAYIAQVDKASQTISKYHIKNGLFQTTGGVSASIQYFEVIGHTAYFHEFTHHPIAIVRDSLFSFDLLTHVKQFITDSATNGFVFKGEYYFNTYVSDTSHDGVYKIKPALTAPVRVFPHLTLQSMTRDHLLLFCRQYPGPIPQNQAFLYTNDTLYDLGNQSPNSYGFLDMRDPHTPLRPIVPSYNCLLSVRPDYSGFDTLHTFDNSPLFYVYSRYRFTDNLFYFEAFDSTYGYELWVTDGTASGTRLVKDQTPGPAGTYMYVHFSDFCGDVLYFRYGYLTPDIGVVRSDGTENGTYLLRDSLGSPIDVIQFAVWNNTLYAAGRNIYTMVIPTPCQARTGMAEVSRGATRQLVVYPNPADGFFTISLPDGRFEVTIIDGTGRRISTLNPTSTPIKLDCSHLSPGLYYIQARGENTVLSGKVLVY